MAPADRAGRRPGHQSSRLFTPSSTAPYYPGGARRHLVYRPSLRFRFALSAFACRPMRFLLGVISGPLRFMSGRHLGLGLIRMALPRHARGSDGLLFGHKIKYKIMASCLSKYKFSQMSVRSQRWWSVGWSTYSHQPLSIFIFSTGHVFIFNFIFDTAPIFMVWYICPKGPYWKYTRLPNGADHFRSKLPQLWAQSNR